MAICVIYGPVASGKLTTAEEFAAQTGYRLFHNHLVTDMLLELIPYERQDLRDQRVLLSRQIRKDIISTILATDVDIVVTMNYGGPGGLDLMSFIVETAKQNNQPAYIVRLMPSREELDHRVVGASRKRYNKADSVEILARLLDGEGYGYEKFPNVDHLEIDNTDIPPGEVVRKIIDHYKIEVKGA